MRREGQGSLDLFDSRPAEPDRPVDGAPSDGPDIFTVSEINRAVRTLLEGSLRACWIAGEIGDWTRARSGHRYFTLKDDRAQLRCVMWRSDAERLPTDPEVGMEARVFGSLTLYEARGEFQLTVRKVEVGGTEGLWKLAFEKVRRALEEEGLLAAARKRPVPAFPSCVGVVTSTSGAALRDILTVVRRRAPWTRVVVRGTRVQGEGAALEIARALRELDESGLADVVIVGRGGGSLEDLWAFNEEPVARAIAACRVPVVSGVGHETDVTIADLVADLRAPTPSAAAEAVVRDREDLRRTIVEVGPRMSRAVEAAVRRRTERLERMRRRLGTSLDRLTADRSDAVSRSRRRLAVAVERRLTELRGRLGAVAGRVEALSPLGTLRRGFAVPLDHSGRLLRSVADFPQGRRFELRVVDGRVTCESSGPVGPDRSAEGGPT